MIPKVLFMSGKSISDFLITNWYYCITATAFLVCSGLLAFLWKKESKNKRLHEWNLWIFGLCILLGLLISLTVLITVWQSYTSKQAALDGITKAISSLLAIVAAVPTIYLWAVREKKKEREISQKEEELDLKEHEITQKDDELARKDEESKKQAQQNEKILDQQKLENDRNEKHRESTLNQQEIAELDRSYVEAVNQFSHKTTFLAGSYALVGLINSWLEIGTSAAHNKAHQIIYILFSKRAALEKNISKSNYSKKSEYVLFESLLSELFLDKKYLPLYTDNSSLKFHLIDMSNLNLKHAVLCRASLNEANFSRARLSSANFTDANLSRANLSSANLSDANLNGANLTSTNLSGTNLSGTDLTSADLSDADLANATINPDFLANATIDRDGFYYAHFTDADLNYADFTDADLTDVSLHQAKFNSTSLATATLSDEQLKSIVIIDPKNN